MCGLSKWSRQQSESGLALVEAGCACSTGGACGRAVHSCGPQQSTGAADSQSIYAKEKLPPTVKAVLENSCANCHSNQTEWPWYSHVAPVSWMIASDVHEARRKMNFSEWAEYPANKREDKLEEICEQVTNGDMPDPANGTC